MNKLLVLIFVLTSSAHAGVFTDKYKNFQVCLKAVHAQSDSVDMPVKGRQDIIELCRGTHATGPLACAKAANAIAPTLSSVQVAQLCSGATNTSPVDCMKEATRTIGNTDSFIGSLENSLRLCAKAKSKRSLECAKELAREIRVELVDAPIRSVDDVAAVCSFENF